MNKYKTFCKAAILLVIALLFIINYAAYSKKRQEAAQTEKYISGLYQVKYRNLLNYYSTVLIEGDSVYLPVFDLFARLKIYYEFDSENNILKGFFINQTDNYLIDFNKKSGFLLDKTTDFTSSDFVFKDGDLYVLPSLLNRIFSINFNISSTDLSVFITSPKDLPVYLFYLKSRNRQNNLSDMDDRYEDLLFGRKRSLLDGLILNYDAGVVNNSSSTSYTLRSNLGLEVMGGALTASANAGFEQLTKKISKDVFFVWDYVFDENRYLNQFSAGYVTTSSLSGTNTINNNLLGIKISNEPIEYNTFFSDKTIEGTTHPGWLVELYLNNRQMTQVRAGKDSTYKFEIPLHYGYNKIALKFYGRKGEIEEKNNIVYIPSFLTKPGEFDYSIVAGKSIYDNQLNSTGLVTFGLTDWLSISGGLNRNFTSRTYDYYSYLSFNLFDNLNINLLGSKDNYGLDIMQSFADYSSLRSIITYYRPESEYAKRNMVYNAHLAFTPPFISFLPVHFNFQFSRVGFSNHSSNSLEAYAITNLSSVNFKLKYNSSFADPDNKLSISNYSHFLSGQVNYRLAARNVLWSVFDRMSFSLSTYYDLNRSLFRSARAAINKSLAGMFQIGVGINKDFLTKKLSYYGMLNLNLYFGGVRSSTRGYYYDNGNRNLSQNFSGTLMLDTYEPGILMNRYINRTNVNTGAAAFRFFLDENLDGVYNEGEQIIPDVRVSTDQGSSDRAPGKKLSYIYNIPPYRRINTYVNMESIANPLWIPEKTSFSFIADPNNVKGMEIPCYASGIIEGKVAKMVGSKAQYVTGIKLHLLKSDSSFFETIPVFSDGSFYYMGVPPGNYSMWVDSAQMVFLGLYAKEPVREFRIETTTQGDYVGNLNFELYPKTSRQSQEDNVPRSTVVNKLNEKPANGLANNTGGNKGSSKNTPEPMPKAKEDTLNIVEQKVLLYQDAKDIELTIEMRDYLDYAYVYMSSHPGSKISINAYSDSFGQAEEVSEITDKRAKKALSYLIQKGLSPERISSEGRGSDTADEQYGSPDNRKKSRRLEILILE